MSETRLRLVSWNVHDVPGAPRRPERIEAIAELLALRAPDLVLLQEVWSNRAADTLAASLGPHGYDSVEIPDGRGIALRKAGLLAFVSGAAGWHASAPRFHEFEVEAPAWKVWEGDGLGDKGVLGFRLARGDFACEVLLTHLQAAYEPRGYATVRRAQLAELRAQVEAAAARHRPEAVPVLVAGDLNTTPDEAGFDELRDLDDLSAPLRQRCGCGTVFEDEGKAPWIDYLLALPEGWQIGAELALIQNEHPDVPYSDHQGLEAAVMFTPPTLHAALPALLAATLAGPVTRRELLARATAFAASTLGL